MRYLISLFSNSMVGPIITVSIIVTAGLFYFIPTATRERTTQHAVERSEHLVDYIRTFRAYYNDHIVPKIRAKTDLKLNYDHMTKEDTLPLPATTVHDLGDLFTKDSDVKVQMYSKYPFPNRAKRRLDSFQKEALAHLIKNPGEIYVRNMKVDGKSAVRVAVPDFFTSDQCVNCHNTRADTPKNDWKLGDIRGVIEVDVPVEGELIHDEEFMKMILLFVVVNLLVLFLHFSILSYRRSSRLSEAKENLETKVNDRTRELVDANSLLEQYRHAVDVSAIVSKTDKNGIITYVNKEFEDISGYSKEELLGRTHNILRHKDVPKKLFRDMWRTILSKKIWQGIIKNRAKDGTSYFVNATILPILDSKNNISEFLAIRYNVTDLILATEKAKSAELAKTQFLANMSHELRTPLNAILGFSQILMARPDTLDVTKEYINKISISGTNLLNLVNTILDFSKIESGKMETHFDHISLKALFQELAIIIEPQQVEKKLTLRMPTFGDEVIVADPQLLKQTFINLLSNALKFTPPESKISISYDHDEETDQHLFIICDQGNGIPDELMDVLFEPFYQGSNSKESAISGTGLGLALSKRIISELHHGEIWVKNRDEGGACFYVKLPGQQPSNSSGGAP